MLNRLPRDEFDVTLNGSGLVGFWKPDEKEPVYGRETVPGANRARVPSSGQKFDATRSARRLLAALRDLERA
jgi:hypothetical protein